MATPSPVPPPDQPIRLVPPSEGPAAGTLAGEPALIAFPSFIVGAVAFGMVLIGVVPAGVVGAGMPIVLTAGLGMFVAAIWSARIGQSAPAGISAIVGSFFVSYALLALGLIHNWYGIPLLAIPDTQKLFTISWLIIVTMLVLATLRLPSVFTLLFALIDVALLLNLLSIIQTSTNLSKAAGWVVMAASAVVVYLFFGSASLATGGKEVPLGPPSCRPDRQLNVPAGLMDPLGYGSRTIRRAVGVVAEVNTSPALPGELTLRDGTPAMIWPLLPTDGQGLREMFRRLSAESRQRRFLSTLSELDDAMIERLVGDVDGVHHIALLLTVFPADGEERPVGIARLIQDPSDPATADVAFTVADDWQGRGVGTALAEALLRRRPAAVRRLSTEVGADNRASLALLAGAGRMSSSGPARGVVGVTVDLAAA